MSVIKNCTLKIFSIAFFLSFALAGFSQASHMDSVYYFTHLRQDSLLGLDDVKGTTIQDFIAKNRKENLFTNDSLHSKITFINFWFETCAPCVAEFPALEKFYTNNKFRKNFQFVSITFEQDTTIEHIREKYKLTYPIYRLSYDSCGMVKGKLGYPANFIVDKTGKIVYYITGGPLDPNIADKFLNYFIQAELDKQLKEQ